jgi:hypothetical protein
MAEMSMGLGLVDAKAMQTALPLFISTPEQEVMRVFWKLALDF